MIQRLQAAQVLWLQNKPTPSSSSVQHHARHCLWAFCADMIWLVLWCIMAKHHLVIVLKCLLFVLMQLCKTTLPNKPHLFSDFLIWLLLTLIFNMLSLICSTCNLFVLHSKNSKICGINLSAHTWKLQTNICFYRDGHTWLIKCIWWAAACCYLHS